MKKEKTFIPKKTALKFIKILKSLISDYYKYVIEREKELCSFGIFTDSDISGFVVYYNIKSENNTDIDKWWLPEWKSLAIKEEHFRDQEARYNQLEKIIDELKGKSTWDFDDKRNTFAIYKREMFDCICDACLLYTSPSPRDATLSRMPSSA